MYTRKIEPTDRSLVEHDLLNVMAHVKFEIPEALGLLEVKRTLGEIQRGKLPIPSLRASLAMARGAAELTRLAFMRAAFSRRAAPSRGKLLLMVDVEQAPNLDSRVRLAEESDRHGVPKAVVDWRHTDLEERTIRRFTRMLAADWERAGLGTIDVADDIDFTARDTLGAARDIYHHMGATRMSDSPRNGVVDSKLRCHDVDNLYVASSSVFPTSGIANPTFTILALTLRLADQLKAVLGEKDVASPAAPSTLDGHTQTRRLTAARTGGSLVV
jgi:choline dehydrogenase-like flavoprotein